MHRMPGAQLRCNPVMSCSLTRMECMRRSTIPKKNLVLRESRHICEMRLQTVRTQRKITPLNRSCFQCWVPFRISRQAIRWWTIFHSSLSDAADKHPSLVAHNSVWFFSVLPLCLCDSVVGQGSFLTTETQRKHRDQVKPYPETCSAF